MTLPTPEQPLKPGFFPHHNEDCDLELRYEKTTYSEQLRGYFCHTHGQWCYERPIAAHYTWANGEVTGAAWQTKPLGGYTADPLHTHSARPTWRRPDKEKR